MSKRSRRQPGPPSPVPRRRRLLALAGLGVAAAAIAAVVVVLVLFVFGGGTSDEDKIESLARRTIEVLPAGEWPSLYDSFSDEYQARCPRQEFNQAGEDSATQLGDDLRFLRFKRVETVVIVSDDARAVIVGETPKGEYKVQSAFRRENGEWKLAPAPGTEGCAAFDQLPG